MLKKIPLYSILVFVFVAACFLTAQITYNETDKQWKNEIERLISTSESELSESLLDVSETVNENSLYKGTENSLADGISKGYVEALDDRFAMYLTVDDYKEYVSFRNHASDRGIGVSTLYDSQREGIYVISVYKGSPAEQSGMVPGDIITHVDGIPVAKLGYFRVMNILGMDEVISKVNLTAKKHDGTYVRYDIQKGQVSVQNITGKSVVADDGSRMKVGIITINRFGSIPEDEVKNFETILASLVMEGCERFVIDLRNNPGGNIETVSQLLDCFLRDGPVFTVVYNSGVEKTVVANSGKTKLPYPYMFAILVNENTVCEAEVFAKALSNASEAQLFGMPTYGKATVQGLHELTNGGAVSLSYAKYIPVASEDFDKTGIVPENRVDLSVEQKMSFTTLSEDNDTQLQAAVKYLCGLEKKEFYD